MSSQPLSGSQFDTSLPFEFDLHVPSAGIADLVNTFFVIRSEEDALEEMMPAYSAQLMVYVRGRTQLMRDDGVSFTSQAVTCTAPLMQAFPVSVEGPLMVVGASLTPLGWQCLADEPVDQLNNCLVPPEQVIEPDALASLASLGTRLSSDSAKASDVFAIIEAVLSERRGALRGEHVDFIGHVTQWLAGDLNPQVDNLYASISLSSRTAQRLTKRYFGVSPTRLAKRYRAIRAAMLLANPDLPAALRDEILNGYYDQAHLIRDMRRYTGRTPTALQDKSIMSESLDPEGHGTGAQILREG